MEQTVTDIKQMLAARQAAVAAAKADGAIPGTASPDAKTSLTPEDIKALGNGLQEGAVAGLVNATEIADSYELDEVKAKEAVAVYKQLTLKKYVRPEGSWIKPVLGYFYAQDDADVVILSHFAEAGKVEQVEVKK